MRWGFLFRGAGVKLPGVVWAGMEQVWASPRGDPAVPGWMWQWCGVNTSDHATTFENHLFFFFFSSLFCFPFCKYHLSTRAWGGGGIHGKAGDLEPSRQPGSDPLLFPPP